MPFGSINQPPIHHEGVKRKMSTTSTIRTKASRRISFQVERTLCKHRCLFEHISSRHLLSPTRADAAGSTTCAESKARAAQEYIYIQPWNARTAMYLTPVGRADHPRRHEAADSVADRPHREGPRGQLHLPYVSPRPVARWLHSFMEDPRCNLLV